MRTKMHAHAICRALAHKHARIAAHCCDAIMLGKSNTLALTHCRTYLRCCICNSLTGNDFTQEGFECIIQYVYGGLVSGVTVGLLDTDKAAVALQAADFFGITALRQATEQFAQRCGASLATDA
jgi:hypothetical protein